MKADLEILYAALRRVEVSVDENARIKMEGKIRRLTGWIKSADCHFESPKAYAAGVIEEMPVSRKAVSPENTRGHEQDRQYLLTKNSPLIKAGSHIPIPVLCRWHVF